MLEPPRRLTTAHNLCFGANIRNIVYNCIPYFHFIKVGCKEEFIARTCLCDEMIALTTIYLTNCQTTKMVIMHAYVCECVRRLMCVNVCDAYPIFWIIFILDLVPSYTNCWNSDGYKLRTSRS